MDERVKKLLEAPQLKQRSKEWFSARPSLITASSAAALLIKDDATCDPYINEYKIQDIFLKNKKCCNPYSSKKQYFIDKCIGSKFKGSVATYWGQKYEQVVSDIYSVLHKTEVLEFGLLYHPEFKWLAASPDGITPEGIMIEIKCPFRRTITGIPPFYYWIQCQLQLEVCNLEFCDFVEYEFVEFVSKEEFLDTETLDTVFFNQGLFIQIEKKDLNGQFLPEHNTFIYPEKELIDNLDKLFEWNEKTIKELPDNSNERISTIFWKVSNKSTVRIKRDKEWFSNAKLVFEKEWKRVEYYKKGDNYLQLIPKKRVIDGSVLNMKSNTDECFI